VELDKIPGLKEAVTEAEGREEELREFAFSGLSEIICGLEVEQLRIPHLRTLLFAKSPFILGGILTAESAAAFLWIVSRDYRQGDGAARDAFVMGIGMQKQDWIAGIREYLNRAFTDAPGGGKPDGKSPIVCMSAVFIHRIAAAYGWTQPQIDAMPVAALYQSMRLISLDENPRATFINRLSDKTRWQKLKEWKIANGW